MCYELKTKKVTKSNTYLVCGSKWCINNKSIDIPNIVKFQMERLLEILMIY
ncbi:hypothetical protein [Pectinatus frisingensis]|uniref:hypothetical protein n=1 Tax=Pectinatus frisingensis TaxID=865 RepID=UPI0018C70C8C|nr:hypothetical protein [Pectinatus frisingensis]